MIINKKFDRLRQWTDERMGAKSKTEASDEFKALEIEMGLRYEGMKENHKAVTAYVKNLSQKAETDDKEKTTPIALLGSSMANHGDDFANDSAFGQCLTMYGRSNERIARAQDTLVTKTTGTWLESSERSLAQMKEYQAARKKLESRRLAYDTAQTKMDKGRKDDFRLEEELRVQKAKYEESNEDVHRRMLDIREQEQESIQDLGDFLEAQLAYYDRCRDILLQLKQEWPAGSSTPSSSNMSRLGSTPEDREPVFMPSDRTRHRVISNSTPASRADSMDRDYERPSFGRSTTFEGARRARGEQTPPTPDSLTMQPLARISSQPISIRDQKLALRPVPTPISSHSEYEGGNGTHNSSYVSSPVSTIGSVANSAFGAPRQVSGERRKAPPPPPPSRAKKPPPPPPPMRRVTPTATYG